MANPSADPAQAARDSAFHMGVAYGQEALKGPAEESRDAKVFGGGMVATLLFSPLKENAGSIDAFREGFLLALDGSPEHQVTSTP